VNARQLVHRCTYLAYRACEALVRLLPLDAAFLLGKLGGAAAYHLLRRRRALALANLQLAFGREKSAAELRDLNRQHFQLLGANLLAGLKSSTLPDAKLWHRISTGHIPPERPRTGWIALISHIGNWELFSHLGDKFPEYRFGAIYQGLANPLIDAHIRRTRARSGLTLFDRRTEMLKCVQFLRDGGVVGVLIDQGAGYAGLWTPLFGRLTSTSTLAATLAIRTRVPVVPLAIYTRGHARWRLEVSPALSANSETDPEEFTAEMNRVLEQQIRVAPADWLWAHNRWKPLRPHVLFARDRRRTYFPPGFDRAKLHPFRILIISPPTTETAQQAITAVEAIEQGRPDTWLAILSTPAAADVWQNVSAIQQIIEWRGNESPADLAEKLRSTGTFDIAVFFHDDPAAAEAAQRAGIPIRAGRSNTPASQFYTQNPEPNANPPHSAAANLHLAQSIGADINHQLLALLTR
jgi:heptosyltransferase II